MVQLHRLFRRPVSIDDLRSCTQWQKIVDTSSAPFALSYKSRLQIPSNKEGFEHLMMFCWEYAGEGSNRLPNAAEEKVASFCTAHLRRIVPHNPGLLFLTSLASDGLFQWLIVTSDPAKGFDEAVDAFPDTRELVASLGLPNMAIRVEKHFDPDWQPIKDCLTVIASHVSVADD